MNDPQNDMLDKWKARNPDFGPQPKPQVPVFSNDSDRLFEARQALKDVMNLTFGQPNERAIWDRCNAALARTSKAEATDTVP